MSLLETQAASYFVQVARTKSLSKAAVELATTQSNVTAKIKQLEDQVGRVLFRRHSRGVELTEAGKVFLKYCEELVRVAEAAQRCVARDEPVATELRIGMFYTSATHFMPDVIATFMSANRGVQLTVNVGSTEEIRAQLANGSLDCALIAGVGVDRNMSVHASIKDQLGWLFKAGRVSADPEHLIETLSTLPIYSVRKGSLYEASIRQLFQDAGVVARMPIFLELGSKEILRAMLLTGMGFTFTSRGVFREDIEAGLFDFRPVVTQLPRLQPTLVTRFSQKKSEIVQAFIAHFNEHSKGRL